MVYARAECNHPRTKLDNVFQQDRSNELTAPGQFDCAMSPATQPNRTAMHSSAELTESNSVPLYTLEVTEIAALTQFFEILDRWDREAHPNTEYVLADADQAA